MVSIQEIKLGEAEVVLAAGAESMSQAPYAVRNARWGTALGVDLKVTGDTRHYCLIMGSYPRCCLHDYLVGKGSSIPKTTVYCLYGVFLPDDTVPTF